MGAINRTTDSPDGEQPLEIGVVDAARQRQALALLLTGRCHTASVKAVDQFLDFASQQKLSLDQLWAAYRQGQPIGATLIVPSAGRTAMTFLSPLDQGTLVRDIGKLVHTACSSQDPHCIRMIQSLVDPDQRLETHALSEGGFTKVACLLYMQRDVRLDVPSTAFDTSVELLTWSEQRRPLFAQAILASYENTMDCPALLGLREIDDIIASHMAAGCFVPEWWYVLISDDRPVAVMLMNRVPHRRAIELVYLGITPAWRRKGIGRKLVSFGLARGQLHDDVAAMILAVDESNTPAKRLYQQLGFVVNARKLAMIFTLL